MDINELLEPNAKKAVFTFGRFNPPTKGHARLMDVVKNASSGADHYVFTGRTNDPKKNPLQYKDKITFLRAMFPHMNIMDNPQIRTPWEALEELGKQYDEIVMVVGSDRKDDFESQMRPYLKDFGIDKFSIVSSGERDADASDVSGVSASKARALAKAGDFKSFSGTIDGGEKLKQQLYTKVRQGMGIMEMANKPKMPKKPEIKSRDPNWRDMEAIRKSGAAGSHKDKKALDKRGYQKHKGKSIDMDEAPKGKPIAYVDMDGVLANFFAEYANLAGVTTGNYKDIPPAKTDPTLDKMVGTDFFNRLPKFPTTDKIIQLVTKEFGSYKILSSPLRGDHENSKQQKIKWIQRELAIQPDEIIVVGRKDSYAVQADGTPNILIDDRGKNIEGWRSRGGYGIKYQADEDPLSKVVDGIKEFKEKNNLTEHGGRVVKGINTTHDVGVDAIKKQSAKFGFKVTKDGVPPIMAPKNLRRVKRMQEALIKINGSNKNLTLQQQIDLQEIKKGIGKMLKATREVASEVPYQNDGGEMSLLTHPGTKMHQKMRATSKPGTEDWFKTWRTLSYLTKGRKNHYMLPVKEELEKLLIKHGIIKENPLQQPQGTQGTQGTVKPNTNNTGIDPNLKKVIGQLDQKAKQDPKIANLISKAFQNVKNFFAQGAVTEDPSVQATALPSASELMGFINSLPADATPEQKHQKAEKYLQGVLAQVSKMQTSQRLSFKQNFDTTLKELATKVATELKKLKSTSPFTNTRDLESQEKLKAKDITSLKNIESKIVTGLSGVFSDLKDIGLIDGTKQQAVLEFLQDLIQGVVSFEEVLSSGAGDINAMYMNAVTTQEKSPDYIEAYNSVKEKMWRTVIDIGKGTNMGPGELGLSLILQPASKGGKGDLAFTTTDADGNEVTQTVELKGSLDPKSGARLGLEMGNKTNQVASYQKLLDKYFGKGKVPYKYPIKTAKGKDSTESLNLTVKGIKVLNQLISQVPGFQTKKFLVDSILLTLEDGETYRKTVEKNKFLDEAINSDGTIDYNIWVRALTLVQYDLYGGEAGKSEFKTIMVFSPTSTNFRVVKNANEFSQAIKDGQVGKPNGIIVSGGLSFNLDKFAKTPQVGIK